MELTHLLITFMALPTIFLWAGTGHWPALLSIQEKSGWFGFQTEAATIGLP
jgi:hypothetical protein